MFTTKLGQSEILQNFYDNNVNLNVDDNIILSSPLLPNQSIKTVLSNENKVGIKMQILTKMSKLLYIIYTYVQKIN